MSTAATGRSLGLLVCLQCRATVRALEVQYPRCPRCYAHIYPRKPHSLALTAALLVCAAVLYIPANLLPVMYTRTLFDDERDTIMSGVLTLMQSGSWPIAVLVFVASIVVPLIKLIGLAWLLIAVRRPQPRRLEANTRLHRLMEVIGRWSATDVFVAALLSGLVTLQNLATVVPGPGVLAFGAVVFLTMVATMTFDQRLLWDAAEMNDE